MNHKVHRGRVGFIVLAFVVGAFIGVTQPPLPVIGMLVFLMLLLWAAMWS